MGLLKDKFEREGVVEEAVFGEKRMALIIAPSFKRMRAYPGHRAA